MTDLVIRFDVSVGNLDILPMVQLNIAKVHFASVYFQRVDFVNNVVMTVFIKYVPVFFDFFPGIDT